MTFVVNLIQDHKGLTLIELLAVIIILSVISAIAVPMFYGYIEKAEKEVCNSNRAQIKKDYEAYVVFNGNSEQEITFSSFIKNYGEDLCPSGGVFSYSNGEIECSVHGSQSYDDSDGDKEEEVPYL